MIEINKGKCIGCGKCAEDCPSAVLCIKEGKAYYEGSCMQCGHCVAICPVKAVSIPEYDMEDVAEYCPDTFTLSPQQFLNAVKFRRSIRNFKEKSLEKEKLLRILEAGRYTATAVNSQGVSYVLVQESLEEFKPMVWKGWLSFAEELSEELTDMKSAIYRFYEAYKKDSKQDRLFFNAPALLVVATDNPWDGGLAAQNIEMMAVAEGLGVLYNGFVVRAINKNPEALKWLDLDGKNICCCMLVGYPDVTYKRTAPRRAAHIIWK